MIFTRPRVFVADKYFAAKARRDGMMETERGALDMKKLKSKTLRRGSKIGIIAPASPIKDPAALETGVEILEEHGYQAVLGESLHPAEAYLAGSDFERRVDLERLWRDESIDAIWCLRGGYGSVRVLPDLYLGLIEKRPKILVGFSDITGIELGLWSLTGLVSFHGPVLTTLESDFTISQAFRMLSGEAVGTSLPWPEADKSGYVLFRDGVVTGPLLGGNLSLICSLLGTCYFPNLEGAILFLEETEEPAYRIDRMLTQLLLSGALEAVAGVIVGRCQPVPGKGEKEIIEVFAERLGKLRCPAAYGFPIGHIRDQWTLPQGITFEADLGKGELILAESPFQN